MQSFQTDLFFFFLSALCFIKSSCQIWNCSSSQWQKCPDRDKDLQVSNVKAALNRTTVMQEFSFSHSVFFFFFLNKRKIFLKCSLKIEQNITRLKFSGVSVKYFKRFQNLFKFILVVNENSITEFIRGKDRMKMCWGYGSFNHALNRLYRCESSALVSSLHVKIKK